MSPIEIGGTDKFFVLDSGLRIYAANAEFDDLYAESINSTKLGADSICGMTIYANSFVEGDTAISSKYAPFYHDHSYLPLSGGLMTGGIQLPNTGGTWVHGMTETKCIVGTPYILTTSTASTYHPILRQNTALGNVFNLGGITISSTDDRFGLYIFKSGRTENGYDYATYWNAVTGTLNHNAAMYVKKDITCESNIRISQYGVGVVWATTYGYAGINNLSNGSTLNLYSLKSGESGWHSSITLIDANGDVQIAAKNHTHSYLPLAGGTLTGTLNIKTGDGYTRPAMGTGRSEEQYVSCVYCNGTTSIAARGTWGGTTYANKTITSSASDVRLKDNIVDTTIKALPVIKQMQFRQFDWNDHVEHQRLGLVADELELIDPKFTIGGGYDEEGIMNVKCIDTLYLTEFAVKGIQELHAIDIEQDKRLSALEVKWQIHESCMESLRYQNIDIRNELSELRTENAALRAELAQLRAMIAA